MSGRSRFTNSINSGSGTPSAYSTSVEAGRSANALRANSTPSLSGSAYARDDENARRVRLKLARQLDRLAYGPTRDDARHTSLRLDVLNRPLRHTVEEDPGVRPQFAPVPAHEIECRFRYRNDHIEVTPLYFFLSRAKNSCSKSAKGEAVSIECFGEELECAASCSWPMCRASRRPRRRNAGRVGSTPLMISTLVSRSAARSGIATTQSAAMR